MAKFYDATGQLREVAIDETVYEQATEAGLSVEAFINREYEAAEGEAPAFDQMVASLGISLQDDPANGIKSSRLKDVMNGSVTRNAANVSPGGGAPESRIIFPAAVLSAVEDKLARDYSTTANAFDRFVALDETIPGTSYVQVVMNYDNVEGNSYGATAQLARPQNMLTLTAAERMGAVPTISTGIEWSDQFAQNTTIDFLALSMARTVAVQRDRQAQSNVLMLLNGDIDVGQGALDAQFRDTAQSFDSEITEAGELTQQAWVKWLYKNGDIRTINAVITDIDGALAIENRKGKPVIVGDDPNSPRIDSQMRIANPAIPAEVEVFITRNPNWPSGTILGFDKRYGIRRVKSLSANYNATSHDAIRRANAMRMDHGSIAMRYYDEAFAVLELTV